MVAIATKTMSNLGHFGSFWVILSIFYRFGGPTDQWMHIVDHVIHQNDRIVNHYQDEKKEKEKNIIP